MKNNMPPLLRPIIIALCAYLLFNSWLIIKYQDHYINTTPIVHIEKEVIKPIIYDKQAIFTAYNAVESQTDGSPCVGAGNHNLCEISKWKRVCASRLYPLHTIILIDGIGECEILDRTSIKNGKKIDILTRSKQEAINFGKKEMKYRVIYTPSN